MKRPWDINEFCARVHKLNAKWWQDLHTGKPIQRSNYELLALVISELAECLEGERKGLMDDHLPHRRMAEVEMADAYIRLADYTAGFGYNLSLEDPVVKHPEGGKGDALFFIMEEICPIYAHPEYHLAEAFAMIEGYCDKYGYDLFGAIEEKLAYNAVRKDHTHEARKAAGGKAF